MMAEREGVIPGSADAGVGYLVPLAGNYGEINVGVYNGEGYASTEIEQVQELPGPRNVPAVPVGACRKRAAALGLLRSWLVRRGAASTPRDPDGQLRARALRWHGAVADIDPRPSPLSIDRNARGYSVFAEVRQGLTGWAGIARFDSFDPDRDTPDDVDRRVIAGVASWLTWSNTRVGLLLNDENVSYDAGRGRPDENRLLLQAQVQF